MKPIPKDWTKYQSMGRCVAGTKIIPFKVPLKLEVCSTRIPEEEWFTPAILLQKQPGLKIIIDLTDTNRYYDPQEFKTKGVKHIKINVPGGGRLPPFSKLRQFFDAVDEFMDKYADDPDALIGVHCTHGLNRTGYFICKYMVNRSKIPAEDAISKFEAARGYPMERKNYLDHIKKINANDLALPRDSLPASRNINKYSSPLDKVYTEDSRRVFRHAPSRFYANKSFRKGADYSNQSRYDPRNQQKVEENGKYESPDRWRSWRANRYKHSSSSHGSSSSSRNWRERP